MSFVSQVSIDKRVGVMNEELVVTCGTAEMAVEAIRLLNGAETTEVCFEGLGRVLTIAGGNDGRYVGFIAVDIDEAFFNLLNPAGSADVEVKVVAGGQAGLFPTCQVVDLETASRAVAYFFWSGEADPNLTWDVKRR